jgi:hypothetical protein
MRERRTCLTAVEKTMLALGAAFLSLALVLG